MPWNWGAPSAARGTPAEAAQPGAWPAYQDEVLLQTLDAREKAVRGAERAIRQAGGRPDPVGEAAMQTYLDKASRNFEEEADEALHSEFQDWLQGKHEVNYTNPVYNNTDGAPIRRHVYGPDVGTKKSDWQHTPWGSRQLTHLHGVRDHLRAQAIRKDEAELQMNLLAEHGPANLQEAWMYFKHWVKKRPIKLGPLPKLGESSRDIGIRSRGWDLPPEDNAEYNSTMPPTSFPLPPPTPARVEAESDFEDAIEEDFEAQRGPAAAAPPAGVGDALEVVEEGLRAAADTAAAAIDAAAGAIGDPVSEAVAEAVSTAQENVEEGVEDIDANRASQDASDFYDKWFGDGTFDGVMNAPPYNATTEAYVASTERMLKEREALEPELRAEFGERLNDWLEYQASLGSFGPSETIQRQWVDALRNHAVARSNNEKHQLVITDEMLTAADLMAVDDPQPLPPTPVAAEGGMTEEEKERKRKLLRDRATKRVGLHYLAHGHGLDRSARMKEARRRYDNEKNRAMAMARETDMESLDTLRDRKRKYEPRQAPSPPTIASDYDDMGLDQALDGTVGDQRKRQAVPRPQFDFGTKAMSKQEKWLANQDSRRDKKLQAQRRLESSRAAADREFKRRNNIPDYMQL